MGLLWSPNVITNPGAACDTIRGPVGKRERSHHLIPLAAGVWALVTLQRIRTTQEAMRLKLEAIERSLGSA